MKNEFSGLKTKEKIIRSIHSYYPKNKTPSSRFLFHFLSGFLVATNRRIIFYVDNAIVANYPLCHIKDVAQVRIYIKDSVLGARYDAIRVLFDDGGQTCFVVDKPLEWRETILNAKQKAPRMKYTETPPQKLVVEKAIVD